MRTRKISKDELMAKLLEEKRTTDHEPLVIEGFGTIDCEGLKFPHGRLSLKNLTFTDLIIFSNFKGSNIEISDCNLKGLKIDDSEFDTVLVRDSEAEYVDFFRCKVKRAYLVNLAVTGDIEISGLELSEFIHLENIEYKNLHLRNLRVREMSIKTPYVTVEDPVIAHQFHLAGIDVFTSTNTTRKMLSMYVPTGRSFVQVIE